MRPALPFLPLAFLLAGCGGAAEEGSEAADAVQDEDARAVTLASFGGDWSGTLEVGGQRLPLVLHVDPYADVPVTLDSPAQGAFGLEATAAFEDGALVATWADLGATYTAMLAKAGDAISGQFVQSGQSFRLRLTRSAAPIAVPNRPQAVVGTPPYAVVTGSAQSAPDTRLAYTLTLPEAADGLVPGVVLISGSGPQDRDETIAGHKPFAVLADRLTRSGVAVLRLRQFPVLGGGEGARGEGEAGDGGEREERGGGAGGHRGDLWRGGTGRIRERVAPGCARPPPRPQAKAEHVPSPPPPPARAGAVAPARLTLTLPSTRAPPGTPRPRRRGCRRLCRRCRG